MFLRLLPLLLLPASLFAATLRVNNTPGTSPDYTTIQAAIEAAAEGDTLLVEGSTTAYAGFIVSNKRLNIIGPGYALVSNLGTPANKLSAVINDHASINASTAAPSGSSDGSLIMGLEFQKNLILFDCNNVTVARCLFRNQSQLHISGSGNLISQSYIQGTNPTTVTIYAHGSGTRIENCLMPELDLHVAPMLPDDAPPFVCYLRNNFIKMLKSTEVSLIVENNIFKDTPYESFPASVFKNNICGSSFPNYITGTGNIGNVMLSQIMAGHHFNSTVNDSEFRLSPLDNTNPASNGGTDGTHIGPFGGANPYVLSGVPPLPSIDELSVPTFAAPGSDITIRIKVGNRP